MPTTLETVLGLSSKPIAISFRPTAPEGIPRVATREPAGCGYWRRAAAGEVFYTGADDHKLCPVGAHTHNVSLSPAEAEQLQGLVGTMIGLEYLTMDDVARIPRRAEPFGVAVYAPLDRAPVPPDVVLVRGNARQLMLLAEAAQAARVRVGGKARRLMLRGEGAEAGGVAASSPAMGRPTCAVLPESINSG